jgi:hypothetical protein
MALRVLVLACAFYLRAGAWDSNMGDISKYRRSQ